MHYIFCRCVRRVAESFLNLRQYTPFTVDHFMLAHKTFSTDKEVLTCMAVLVYAVYNTTNHFRLAGGTDADTAFEAMKQHCRNAVAGHCSSMRVVDSRWLMRPQVRQRRSEPTY